MLINKKVRQIVYNQIFRDGVYVVRDSRNFLDSEKQTKNIEVIKLLKGLSSRGLVRESYSWKIYYFVLNDKGVEYLRRFLNLPNNVVPFTYKKNNSLNTSR